MIDAFSARSRAVVSAVVLAVAVAAVSAASAASPPPERGAKAGSPTDPAPAVKADRDGDRVFDDLESRLAEEQVYIRAERVETES